jgi:3-methyl-2-oxobutanoate hydroxymethyltransferase
VSTTPAKAAAKSDGAVRKKISIRNFHLKKKRGEPITMLTAYDYPTALAVDKAGIDSILVGDSLGMVVLGYENTLPVTMEDMLHHCKAVSRGASKALLIGDMPFMSYQVSVEQAVANAGRFLQEAGMDAVKLEGGVERADAVRQIVAAGIPVMGHLAAKRLLDDAFALQEAGAFSLVLESVPTRLAQLISQRLTIPTIGIGAGIHCDGQVLVTHDLLGLFDRFTPKFVKQYAGLHGTLADAFAAFKADIENKAFPAEEHSVAMKDKQWEALLKEVGSAELNG